MVMYYGALASRPDGTPSLITRDGLSVLCAWCLKAEGIEFPAHATSTICPAHAAQVLAQHRARADARDASAGAEG